MEKGCIVYCRAVEAEVERLRAVANGHGWTVCTTITEDPCAPNRRAGLGTIRRMLASGEVNALVVPSLLLLGATLDETVALVAKIAAAKADLIIEAEGIDTSTIKGAAWLAAVASLQGYKEAVRRENARAGQHRARVSGVHCGRPALKPAIVNKLNALLRSGHGVRAASRLAGCSPARAAAEKKAMMAAENLL